MLNLLLVNQLFLVPFFEDLQEAIVQNVILTHKTILRGLQGFMSLLHYFWLGSDGRMLDQTLPVEPHKAFFSFPDFFFHVFNFSIEIDFLQNESVKPIFGYQILFVSLVISLEKVVDLHQLLYVKLVVLDVQLPDEDIFAEHLNKF